MFVFLITLPSCFVMDSFLEEDKPSLPLPLDVVVKDSIYHYIQSKKADNQKYLSYGYQPMKIIVPQAIKNLEKWESRKGGLEFDQNIVDQQINYFDSIIKKKKLSRKISVEHVFSLRENANVSGELQSVDFILSNELKVIDLQPKFKTNLSTKEEKVFAKFYYQATILKSSSYEESQKLSRKFYDYFKTEWEAKDNVLDKSVFLSHIINVVTVVDSLNVLDVQVVAEKSLLEYMLEKRTDIEKYKVIDFSALYQIDESKEDEGYYFFHTFSFENEGEPDNMSVYVKFNSFYEVKRIVETNQSYDVLERYRK